MLDVFPRYLYWCGAAAILLVLYYFWDPTLPIPQAAIILKAVALFFMAGNLGLFTQNVAERAIRESPANASSATNVQIIRKCANRARLGLWVALVMGSVLFFELLNNKDHHYYSDDQEKEFLSFCSAVMNPEIFQILIWNLVAIIPLFTLTIINFSLRNEYKPANRFLLLNNYPLIVGAISMFVLAFLLGRIDKPNDIKMMLGGAMALLVSVECYLEITMEKFLEDEPKSTKDDADSVQPRKNQASSAVTFDDSEYSG
jgi:hypothetical protein